MATDKLVKMQKDAGLQYPPTELTYQYRLAIQGEGGRGKFWKVVNDKDSRFSQYQSVLANSPKTLIG